MSNRLNEDALSSIFHAYQLHAGIYAAPKFCGQWQVSTSGHRRSAFHVIGEGSCWLHLGNGRVPQRLDAGDIVMFPHDDWHMLAGAEQLNGNDNFGGFDGSASPVTLICGYFEFQAGDKNPVLDALPDLILVKRTGENPHLADLCQLLLAEVNDERPGTNLVMDKLADALFVMVIRHYLATATEQRGLLAGMADARLRKALEQIHQQPSEHWTLDLLAQAAGMSRASFAQHFAERVGVTPIEYLTRWRMVQAELALRNPQVSVAQAASDAGYETEAAFRKAFKRVHGIGPGMLRRWLKEQINR